MARFPAKILDPGRFVMRVCVRASLRLILVALCLVGGGHVFAQTADIFTVKGVPIDETAESAAAARNVALASGRKAAYQRLLARLVPLNVLGNAPAATPELLSEIVAGIAIDSEKTSSVRYLAELTVRFSPDAVRRRFRATGLRWAETSSRPLVVLPVYRTQGTVQLWDTTNLWHKAWQELPDSDALIRLVVPEGQAADLADISPDQALAGDDARIEAIGRRYGTGGALLVVATLQNGDQVRGALEVSVSRFGPGGADRTSVDSYAGNAETTVASVMAIAALQVRRDIEEGWKQDNLLRFGEQQELVAVAPLSGLPALIRLKALLMSVAEIQVVELLSVARDRTRIRLQYLGDPSQLVFALAQKDLVLNHGAVDWQLSDGAAQ
jgi:hypothetical protein